MGPPSWRGTGPAWGVEVTDTRLRAVSCDSSGKLGPMRVVERDRADSGAADFRRLRASGVGSPWILSLPPSWTIALPVHLPPAGAVEELLVERARAQLSFPVEEAVLDYLEPEARPDGSRRVLLYAVPSARATALVEQAAAAGGAVLAVESSGTGLQRALAQANLLDRRQTLVVHVDDEHVLFLIADHERIAAERALAWGMSRIAAAVASQLEVPPAGVPALLAPVEDPDDPEAGGDVARAVGEIAAPHLAELEREAERMQAYCRSEFRDRGVERVLLTGLAAEVRCLRDGVNDWSMPVEVQTDVRAGSGAVSGGLALRRWEKACAGSI
jgi:Tfp pilus assembly PilM family ATPase